MSDAQIQPDAIVHVPTVIGHPEWNDRLAFVKAVVYRHGCRFVWLGMWPCGWSPEVSSVTTVPMASVSLVAPPVPAGEVRGG